MAHEVDVVKNALIAVKGGELAADLFLPRGASQVPALVMLTPYNKDWAAGGQFWQSLYWFAEHGYACLLVDFRGTGSSSGNARAPFDSDEAEDGLAAIEWAARQPWCDGNVGMWGISYGAITSLRTASRQPPALKAIVPIMGHIDPERDFVHPCGVRGCLSPLAWSLHNLILQLTPPMYKDASNRWQRVWRERLDTAEPYFADLLTHGPGDPEWRTRVIDASKIRVPSLCVIGWRDLFADGMLRAYQEIQAPKRLVAGPWMHVLPHESPNSAIDFLPIMLRWWDRWLRGDHRESESESADAVFIQGSNRWQRVSWPRAEQTESCWYTDASGGLQPKPVGASGVLRKEVDSTIGIRAGLPNYHSFGYGMPEDQSDDDLRGITFTSAPLETPLTIIGRPRLLLDVTAEGRSESSIVAKLADVQPDGRSVFITAGVASLRSHAENSELTLTLAPTAYEIAAGNRLRVMVANGDFPRLWPDSNASPLSVRSGGESGTRLMISALTPGGDVELYNKPSGATARPSPHVLESTTPAYTVSRDTLLDTATVAIKTDDLLNATDFASTIRFEMTVSAVAARDRPAETVMRGTASATINSGAETLRVSAHIVVKDDVAMAEAEVTQDNKPFFSRRWSV
jgi:hypothetical protein